MRPMILGTLAAFFFAFTFIINRSMELEGGSWIWSASLRYFFMIPFLVLLVYGRKNLKPLFEEMKNNLRAWLVWSFVGFVLFYGPICFSAAYAPRWLIASTWQITIISGSLLAPFFVETVMTQKGPVKIKGRIPIKGMAMSSIILLGIILMQVEQADSLNSREVFLGVIPVIIASFAYPLGNRKMMDVCGGRLDVFQRVLGMTIASMPLWIVLAIYGMFTVGPPSIGQSVQSGIIAITSGVIATILFFKATDLVRGNMQKLGNVEATQSGSVLFSVIGELILLKAAVPSIISWTGMSLVIGGMILHSCVSHKGGILNRKKATA
ncbi:multidrug resistance efflux transporter family protein [Neobacillus sp. NPDC093182]|uniref:DMT family transporter n=1 Tax=Neobacillus sp. NPDC093182 TaxID=3364297 RepID=UPI0038122BEC